MVIVQFVVVHWRVAVDGQLPPQNLPERLSAPAVMAFALGGDCQPAKLLIDPRILPVELNELPVQFIGPAEGAEVGGVSGGHASQSFQ